MVIKSSRTSSRSSRRDAMPRGAFAPELCKPLDSPPAGDDWLHEVKWDGYRILTTIKHGEVQLWSRNAIEWTAKLPDIVRAIDTLNLKDAQLDGELIALKGDRSDFNLLKARLAGESDTPLVYELFDLPYINGRSLAGVSLIDRKTQLEKLLVAKPHKALRYSAHVIGGGTSAFEQAIAHGLEGIVSKKIDSPYRAGRSGDWAKTKGRHSDEFVVVGYTAPKGSRSALGSLLLGRADGDTFRYAGRCGTGFDERLLKQLKAALKKFAIDQPAVDIRLLEPRVRSTVRWVQPTMVVEVFFLGMGRQGLLRHSVFKSIREDKSVSDLVPASSKPKPKKVSRSQANPAVDVLPIRITHPDRLMFEDLGVSKAYVADYYRAVMPQLLTAIANRPLSIVRCPDGIGHEMFFQKHAGKGWGEHIHSARARKGKDVDPYLYVKDATGVLELVQMNTIEFHPWGSTLPDVDHADRIVFDLDPDTAVAWKAVKEAATDLRELLTSIGLQSFVRTTGGKGLHVVVPLSPAAPWEQAKAFSHAVAATLSQSRPGRFVEVANKEKRKGKIFIDWLRNGRGSTSVASYSLRARPGAKVAVPIFWDELTRLKAGDQYNLKAVTRRLAKLKSDPWPGIEDLCQSLDGIMLK